MGEDAAQAEKFQHPKTDVLQEKPSTPSPMPSSTPSASLNLGSTEETIRDNSQVNAVTVHTLLDKLVNMLDAVRENQHNMEQRQINLEGSVKGIQNDLTKLSKYQASTSNTVSKLLEKSRKVSAHTRAVRERLEKQCVQVKRLENNHAQLLRRNHFKVLIFQVSVSRIPLHPLELSPPSSQSHLPICPASQASHTQKALSSSCLLQATVKCGHKGWNLPILQATPVGRASWGHLSVNT